MAWMGAIAAAAACCNDGRRRKRPSKSLLLVTIFSLVLGIFVPLVIILGMNSSSTMTLFPIIFIFIIMIGMIVLVAAGFSESFDQANETGIADGVNYRSSDRNQKQRNTFYRKYEPKEEYYWGSEPKSTAHFCTNCGMRLESDDRFCSSCGRRVN